MINAGTFTGKLTNYGIKLTNNGKPQIACTFQIISDDTVYNLTWFGSFNEGKAQEMTIKTLMSVMDLMCEPSEIETYLDRIASQGVESGLLNTDKDYSLVIEHEVYEGKTRAKIKWVNNVGGSSSFEKLAQGEAKKMFSGLNLGGTVASFKAANPGLVKKKEVAPF
jgi:hypothetical protein